MNHYDSNGNHVGYSKEGVLGGENHYDRQGNQIIGYSVDGLLGGENHYDVNGRYESSSCEELFGVNTSLNDDTGSIFDSDSFE